MFDRVGNYIDAGSFLHRSPGAEMSLLYVGEARRHDETGFKIVPASQIGKGGLFDQNITYYSGSEVDPFMDNNALVVASITSSCPLSHRVKRRSICWYVLSVIFLFG